VSKERCFREASTYVFTSRTKAGGRRSVTGFA
jgi:hypothetical protein